MFTTPASFSTVIDNPYIPLKPGTTFISRTDNGVELIKDEVLRGTKIIDGVECVVVLDRSFVNGKIAEKTFDYFAQDTEGNLWYFGEDVKNYVHGVFHDTHGSWRAGVDGDAGIIMPAEPRKGQTYTQENAPGVAQDTATVLSVKADIKTTYADFGETLKTSEFSPLEPLLHEQKYYATGIGEVSATDLTTGEVEALIRIELDGTSGADLLKGNVGRDILRGHGGGDEISGLGGNDALTGGKGADRLTGGGGDDSFRFSFPAETGTAAADRDTIVDFGRGRDRLDLHAIDANGNLPGDGSFDFVGTDPFGGTPGELRIKAHGSDVVVEGDVNGDGHADLSILVKGVHALGDADFLL